MLCALLTDFRRWGAVHTVSTLDPRLRNFTLPADEAVEIEPGQHDDTFRSLLSKCDATLIIAPETDGVLARLSAAAEEAGVTLLGSTSAAAAAASHKGTCSGRFRSAGLPVPPTRQVSFSNAPRAAWELGYPLVAKPIDGAGCEGVYLIAGQADLSRTLSRLRRSTHQEEILLQRFVDGTHASVSLLVAGGRAVTLSLNRQEIDVGRPFTYHGCVVPLQHPAAARALFVARAAVGLIPGLRGYVGVDLVLTRKEAFLMEINPRITTSYVALSRTCNLNLAHAIWDACCRGVLPAKVSLSGKAAFIKGKSSHLISHLHQ